MLNFSDLKKRNLLSNESMSSIRGGHGTCGFLTKTGAWDCNVSKNVAMFMLEGVGGHWCCDSCASSSYCGDGRSNI